MSSPSASTAKAPVLRIEEGDATYKSLASLLSAPASSAASHIALLTPQALSSSFTHYMATLPISDAATFAQLLVRSQALWSQPARDGPGASNLKAAADGQATSVLARSQLVFEAAARSVLARVQVITNQPTSRLGFTSRKPLVSWIKAIIEAITTDAASVPRAAQPVPLPSFALLTGLVAGLHAVRVQSKTLAAPRNLATRYALSRAEDEWCIALSVCVEMLAGQETIQTQPESASESSDDAWEAEFRKHSDAKQTSTTTEIRSDPYSDVRIATLCLASQVSSLVEEKRLLALPSLEQVIPLLATTMLDLFEDSGITTTLREDVRQDAQGQLTLTATSDTIKRTKTLQGHPLYPALGPLSKLLSVQLSKVVRSQTAERAQEVLSGSEFGSVLGRMASMARSWQAAWQGCRLSNAKSEQIAETSRPQTELLWATFKTWLFSYTMVFDALMEAVIDVCPSPTMALPIQAEVQGRWLLTSRSNIHEAYLNIVETILMTYARMSWVTASFGSTAFDAYRRVFFEALEVLSRDNRASIKFMDKLLQDNDVPAHPRSNAARRAVDTFTFDVVEQLITQLPDEMLLEKVLPLCRPYLENREHQETFESAHSAVLSMFASEKDFVLELTPYYVGLLLTSYPTHLNKEQLTYAMSTVVNAASDRSDTVAWHTLETLWLEIEKERHITSDTIAAAGTSQATEREVALRDVYIAQVPNVNLVLLRSVLRHVKSLILQTEAGSDARLHLCEQTYSSLAGLDASTREEGVRWWLAEREVFGI